MPQICLNSIVKNEEQRIERMLKSVIDHIDCAVVVDTGSTDGTKDTIRAFFAAHKKPVEIHDAPFVDWSQARNAALDAARNSKLAFDCMLLVDADMELVIKDPRWRYLDPSVNVWMMMQSSGGMTYANPRLVKRSAATTYVGVTHEYLEGDPVGKIGEDAAFFNDRADGANRPDKFKRDIRLLKEALRDQSISTGLRGRYLFYLAQSYRDAGQFYEAKRCYEKLIELGGWDEEQFFARYYLAYCCRNLGDTRGFVTGLLDAYNYRPSRAEPLYDLANYFRLEGKNGLGYIFGEAASGIPLTKDLLFVTQNAYGAGPKEEMSICGYYLPHQHEAGYNAANELSLDPHIAPGQRELARRNLGHYIRPIMDLASVKFHQINIPLETGWTALNPSVANINGCLRCIVRAVNYVINEQGQYVINGGGPYGPENPIDTRNFLVDIDRDTFEAYNVMEIVWPAREQPCLFPLVRGLEDMRLFEHGYELYASTTVREANVEGYAEQCLVKLEPASGRYTATEFRRMIPYHGRFPAEKNWMPFPNRYGEGIKFVYRAGQVILANGEMRHNSPSSIDVNALAGGSQVVRLPTGQYLAIVHEARQDDHDYGKRWYWHRWMLLNEKGQATAVSRPFYFFKKQIEFCAGLALHPNGKQLVISFGVVDREAWLAVVDREAVMGGLFGQKA